MEILTEELRKLVDSVSAGVGNIRLLPATSYVKVYGENGKLSLTATDGVNFLTSSTLVQSSEVFGPVVVQADSFIKLPGKTTKQSMKLTVLPDALEVIGNGKYKVPCINAADFPDVTFEKSKTLFTDMSPEKLKKVFTENAAAIASDMTYPMLTGYLVGNGVITTNRVKMVLNNCDLLPEDKILVSQRFADLLMGFTSSVNLDISADGALRASSATKTLVGPQLAGLTQYPDITGLKSIDPKQSFTVNRAELLAVLDRVMLFVDTASNFGIRITFDGTDIVVSDLQQNSEERMAFTGDFTAPFTLNLNTKFFTELLTSLSGESVTIQFGERLPVKIVENDMTILLSPIDPNQQ